mmetsp:Transcript_9220/g.29686  ORF Transcript_9220/g.29686 Transcript_9220/m.29686 type:complete len:258 (+) Transcript_9220:125-898(+)
MPSARVNLGVLRNLSTFSLPFKSLSKPPALQRSFFMLFFFSKRKRFSASCARDPGSTFSSSSATIFLCAKSSYSSSSSSSPPFFLFFLLAFNGFSSSSSSSSKSSSTSSASSSSSSSPSSFFRFVAFAAFSAFANLFSTCALAFSFSALSSACCMANKLFLIFVAISLCAAEAFSACFLSFTSCFNSFSNVVSSVRNSFVIAFKSKLSCLHRSNLLSILATSLTFVVDVVTSSDNDVLSFTHPSNFFCSVCCDISSA